MPSRMTQESYRPRVSNRTMVAHSAIHALAGFEKPRGVVVSAKMKLFGLSNHADRAAVRVEQTVGLDARERSCSPVAGELFSLDIPFDRTSRLGRAYFQKTVSGESAIMPRRRLSIAVYWAARR